MALYASTEERFTRHGPITAVTWGGPYVGGYQLADAVRHQENAGKLRLARFHNVGDGVPHLPLALFSFSKKGAKHHHVGMNIRLPMIRKGVLRVLGGQPQPSVSYNGSPKFFRSVLRQWNVSGTRDPCKNHREKLMLLAAELLLRQHSNSLVDVCQIPRTRYETQLHYHAILTNDLFEPCFLSTTQWSTKTVSH